MTDQVARMTELQSSAGTNMVLAGVVILAVLSVLGLLVAYLRVRLRDEMKDREQERVERQKLFDHVLEGNGDRTKPGLKQLGERFDLIANQQKQLADQQRELGEYVVQALGAGEERMGRIEGDIGRISDSIAQDPCRRAGAQPGDCPAEGGAST